MSTVANDKVGQPTVSRTEGDDRIPDQQDSLCPHDQWADLKQVRVRLLYRHRQSMYTTGSEETVPHLKLVSKFILDPGCHLRLYSVYGQKHVTLKVDDLREYHGSLTDILREPRWILSTRNELKVRRIKGNACLRETLATVIEPPAVKGHSS